ncbi:MAG: response regulator [Candidatus Omnitrophica bacterium]|nr:response regulator [Candidatus Omnitrophota bacterium]
MAKRILVIDDDALLRQTFKRLLTKKGFEVFAAGSGREVFDCVENLAVDLVICDLRMPGMDGFKVMNALKHFWRSKKLMCPPEILVSGYRDEIMEAKVSAMAPSGVLWKPFGAQELLLAVKKALAVSWIFPVSVSA